MTRVSVDELHHAEYPGDGGVHFVDGKLAIPLGMRIVYRSPQVQARLEWERLRAAGGRDASAGEHPYLARCSECEICIGRGYYETELYILATEVERKNHVLRPHWRFLCGTCATVYNGPRPLSFGYCLICEADWSTPQCRNLKILSRELVEAKKADLARQLIPAWNTFFRGVKAAMVARGERTLIDLTLTRRVAFRRFALEFAPTPLTYSELSLPGRHAA